MSDLATLPMGVRVDSPGELRREFQTAGAAYPKVDKRGNVIGKTDATLSERYYLADASFVVGLEGAGPVVDRLAGALTHPVWQIYLGRKAFVPSQPVLLSCEKQSAALLPALEGAPLSRMGRGNAGRLQSGETRMLRYVIETDTRGDGEPRPDVPVSFAKRTFGTRYVKTEWRPAP